jgi:hypothetical protein
MDKTLPEILGYFLAYIILIYVISGIYGALIFGAFGTFFSNQYNALNNFFHHHYHHHFKAPPRE